MRGQTGLEGCPGMYHPWTTARGTPTPATLGTPSGHPLRLHTSLPEHGLSRLHQVGQNGMCHHNGMSRIGNQVGQE